MEEFLRRGDKSPWGKIERLEFIQDGVWRVSTPGHGGYGISREVFKNLCPEAKRVGQKMSGFVFFEEDCNGAVLEYELKLEGYQSNNQSLLRWNPEYAKAKGIE